MKKNYILTILIICSCLLEAQSINIMTYNIRYDNPEDGMHRWENRKDFLLSQIKYYEPDIFGTQEGMEHQVAWLNENLSNYSYLGIGRDEGGKGEYCALFYDSSKYEVIESETFWLSETPFVPSLGWDAQINRICTYGLFKNIHDGTNFFVFNLHFDHRGKVAQLKSAELILNKIDSINHMNYPLILMGDFNVQPNEAPIVKIKNTLNDSRAATLSDPFGPEETFCGFDICQPNKFRIDYVFTSKDNIKVNNYAALANIKDMKYTSDHFPVMINININDN